ncbi:MAG: division/cell wall cluster transcriptional repressor MraZ [Oscillospiraceae bacterium]|nr:division/cell wall cluster transcriptional repressor MraZ [Oscillospiraceae bacterium]MCL2278089.1 division/cell wall cluster transcriptional repressor MraZ [Oscillospiraceae bacterium]
MTGNFEHKVDAKGRLFIPSSLRDELGEVFHVTISEEDCLTAYPNESWERLLDKVKSMPLRKQPKMRAFFSNATRCELDSQGRFLLPQKLRDRVFLVKDATIVGAGPFVQIWDSETFRRVDEIESSADNLREVMDELDF